MKKKMLVCDDDIFVRLLVKKVFENRGFEIVEAENGCEAVEIAASQKPDLIIMDYAMPEMNGYEAIREIKEDDSTAAIPVVFLTGLNIDPETKEKLEKEVVVYLVKPFQKSEILEAVRLALEKVSG